MPLRLVKRGRVLYVRGTVRKQSIYETTGTADPKKADLYRAKREAELYERAVLGGRAPVSFQRAALAYLEAEPRDGHTVAYVGRLVRYFEGKMLSEVNSQEAVDRASMAIMKPDAKPSSRNRGIYMPLKAVLFHAARLKWCDAPLIDGKHVPKAGTPWIAPREALALTSEAEPHLKPLLKFLFCTGARLSEALDLRWDDVHLSDALAVLRETKNGKDRIARLPTAAVTELANLPDHEGFVFLRDDGEPYTDRGRQEGGQIKTAWRTACRRAGLIDGGKPLYSPHVTRHSWATWFYAVTKDPLLLKDEGGWAGLDMVERYAHLMKAELVGEVSLVWGASHPRIGRLPRIRAKSVQPKAAGGKSQ